MRGGLGNRSSCQSSFVIPRVPELSVWHGHHEVCAPIISISSVIIFIRGHGGAQGLVAVPPSRSNDYWLGARLALPPGSLTCIRRSGHSLPCPIEQFPELGVGAVSGKPSERPHTPLSCTCAGGRHPPYHHRPRIVAQTDCNPTVWCTPHVDSAVLVTAFSKMNDASTRLQSHQEECPLCGH